MKKLILTVGVVSVGAFIFVAALKAQGIKEGKWSMTMVTKMEGMGQEMDEAMKGMEEMSPEDAAMMKNMMGKMNVQMDGQGMTTTVTQCISSQNPVPEMRTPKDCKQTYSLDGNTVNFQVVCDEMDSTGQVTYKEESMEGVVKSRQKIDGKVTNVTIEISGKYLGPCS